MEITDTEQWGYENQTSVQGATPTLFCVDFMKLAVLKCLWVLYGAKPS